MPVSVSGIFAGIFYLPDVSELSDLFRFGVVDIILLILMFGVLVILPVVVYIQDKRFVEKIYQNFGRRMRENPFADEMTHDPVPCPDESDKHIDNLTNTENNNTQ